jgi:hypothetical protein
MQTFVLCLFWEKFYTITSCIFVTFFAITVFQLGLSLQNEDSLLKHPYQEANSAPRIIHLILDEHIGVAGIPTDIRGGSATKDLISQFYLKNGFQLFGGAFSRYFNTHTSLGNMLNFTAESISTELINGDGPYTLLRNMYFNLLSEKEYHIEVLSPGWINFCAGSIVIINPCIDRDWRSLRSFSKLELPISQKLQVLYGRYTNQSTLITALIYAVVSPLKSKFPALATSIEQWTWTLNPERSRNDPLNTLADLGPLWNDILSLPHGTVLLAHLLIPHYPYVALSDCSIRPPSQNFLWNNRGLLDQPPANTVESRKERYEQYFEQLHCLYLRLGELFDRMRDAGIYDDSIIIVHGDHGSKIVMTEPTSENRHALTNQDLVDGFSTLFAVKLPGKPGVYDLSPQPLEQLLAKFAFEAGLTPSNILAEKAEPYVYLTTGPAKEFIRIPYISPN